MFALSKTTCRTTGGELFSQNQTLVSFQLLHICSTLWLKSVLWENLTFQEKCPRSLTRSQVQGPYVLWGFPETFFRHLSMTFLHLICWERCFSMCLPETPGGFLSGIPEILSKYISSGDNVLALRPGLLLSPLSVRLNPPPSNGFSANT